MRLKLEKEKCNECKECLKDCPNLLTQLSALDCLHCSAEEAECAKACRQNAFFEIAEGILSIDEKLCTACGECVKACERKAIEISKEGKAKKCDLCAKNNFSALCAKKCQNNAIRLEKSRKEIKKIEEMLGFRIKKIKKEEIAKVLRERNGIELVETRQKEKFYLLNGMPELTEQEAEFVRKVLEEFQAREGEAEKHVELNQTMEEFCEEKGLELDEEQKEYLAELLGLIAYGYGPISRMLEDEQIEEIAITGLGEERPVRVFERSFGWMKSNLYYSSESTVKNLANRMAQESERRLTLQNPKMNCMLKKGARINATINPVSVLGPSITIRKFRHNPFTPLELIENNTMSAELAAFLWMFLQTDSSMLIAGNTGSGKTTTMNALFCFIPRDERIIVAEETPEINLPQEHVVKLCVAENLGIRMQELIIDSLRMRPDRIIVGEVRSKEEAGAFIDTLLAGQGKGSYATFHAQSCNEAIMRMKNLGIEEADLSSVDLVLIQRRYPKTDLKKGEVKELRRIVEASEILEKEGRAKENCLFEYDYRKDCLKKKNQSQKIMQKMQNCFGLSKKGIQKELNEREKKLKELQKKQLNFREFFEAINE